MIVQVVPQLAAEKYLEMQTWADLGWKGIIFALLMASLIFGVIKHHIGFIGIGPVEAGIREFCGIPLWKLGPGPHFNIDGFWKVRKAPLAISQIDLKGEFPLDGLTYQYHVAVLVQVINTRQALIDRIYKAEDNDKSNMVNSENTKQVTTILTNRARKLFEKGASAAQVETKLKQKAAKRVKSYGSEICDVLVEELVLRPQSEIADAIRHSRPDPDTLVGGAADEIDLTQADDRHGLEVLDGGSA